MKSRIRVLAMNGSVVFAAELLSDRSVVIYRNGVFVDEGSFAAGRLQLQDEFVPERSRLELQRKLSVALAE